MSFTFALFGFCSIALGIVFSGAIRSDIQIQIVVTMIIGGLTLLGVSAILHKLGEKSAST